MTKSQFLKTLRAKLQVLEESEIDDIIKEYQDHIDSKVKDGKTEAEAIQDFGDLDELVKEILSAYKISGDYVKERSSIEKFINKIVDQLVAFFQDFSKMVSSQKGENIVRLIFKILLILLFVWILRLPFYLIEQIGRGILHIFPDGLYHLLSNLWIVFARFAYIIVSLLTLYVMIRRVIEEEREPMPSSSKQKPLSNEDREEKKEKAVKKVPKEKEKMNLTIVFQPFFVLLKILVVIISLPVWMVVIGLAILLGVLICFCFQGVYLVSVICMTVGGLLTASALLGIIYHLTFHKGGIRE